MNVRYDFLKAIVVFWAIVACCRGEIEETPVEETIIRKLLDLYDTKLRPLLRYVNLFDGSYSGDVYKLVKPTVWEEAPDLEGDCFCFVLMRARFSGVLFGFRWGVRFYYSWFGVGGGGDCESSVRSERLGSFTAGSW